MRSRFSGEYPEGVRVRAGLLSLDRTVAKRVVSDTAPAVSADVKPHLRQSLTEFDLEVRSLKDEERVLRDTLAKYEQRVENAPKRQQEAQDLSQNFQTTKERYDGLLKRYEEAQLGASLEQGQQIEQFRLLDPAIPPREPDAPNRFRLLIVGLFLGIGLAGAAALAAEKLDTAFHSIDELRSFVSVPTLMRVPLILTPADLRRRRLRFAATAASAIIGLILIVAGSYYLASGNEQIVQVMARGNRS